MEDRSMTTTSTKDVVNDETTRPGRWYRPNVDISETDTALWLWADLPGVDEKNVEVELRDGVLTIEGRIDAEAYTGLRPVYTEYGVGNFVQRFRVSSDIDAERIRAKISHGVLELELPKQAARQPRQIPIQAG